MKELHWTKTRCPWPCGYETMEYHSTIAGSFKNNSKNKNIKIMKL